MENVKRVTIRNHIGRERKIHQVSGKLINGEMWDGTGESGLSASQPCSSGEEQPYASYLLSLLMHAASGTSLQQQVV